MPNNDGDFLPSGQRYYVSHELRLRKESPEKAQYDKQERPHLVVIDDDCWPEEEKDEPGEPGVLVLATIVVLALLGFMLGVGSGFFIFWVLFGR